MQALNGSKYICFSFCVLLKYWDKEITIFSLTVSENKNFPLFNPLSFGKEKNVKTLNSLFMYTLLVFFIFFSKIDII